MDPEIGGMVFLDKNGNNVKDGDEENLGNIPRDEYKGITVELWNIDSGNEKLVATVEVDHDTGKYSFGRVRKGKDRIVTSSEPIGDYNLGEGNEFYYTSDDLYEYYVVWNYDGERFNSVDLPYDLNLNRDYHDLTDRFLNDSNGKEINRNGFNNQLETISYNKAFSGTDINAEGVKEGDLSYNTNDNNGNPTSRLQESKVIWNTEDSIINMKARLNWNLMTSKLEDTDYMKYLNLGIREREYGDLSLKKDVVEAEVTVNGFKTNYQYSKLGSGGFEVNDDNTLKKPYSLRIYREDYEFRTSNYDETIQEILNKNNPYTDLGRDNDLQIILTYKITVKNDSDNDNANAVVREIVDYSSSELELKTVTLNGKELSISSESKFKNTSVESSNFNQNFFTGDELNNRILSPGEQLDIILKYKVVKDSNGYIMLDKESGGIGDGKFNVAEIGAYSFNYIKRQSK